MKRIDYKWIVGIVFVFGLFMDLLDMTIVNVAIPKLAEIHSATTTQVQWVVTGYLLSLAVFIPVSGWLGDRFGTKRIFMTALFFFTAASLGCGLSWSLESLIAFRVLQGIGGGMLTPVGTAMLYRAFPPHERAKASAILMIPMVVAPASGPVLGGYLVQYVDWRMIFLINIPVGVLGFAFAGLFLKEERQQSPGRLDVPGLLLAAGGLATLMYALAEAGTNGLSDAKVLVFGAVGLVLLTVFTIVEIRTEEPMIQMRLFKNKLFATANAVQMVGFAGLMGGLFLLPLMLQSPATKGLGAFDSGLTTFPQAIGVVVMVQLAGRAYSRVGPRRMMMLGLAGVTVTTVAFVFINVGTSLWWIRGIMFTRGCFFSFMLVSLQTATFATISPQLMGRASAISNAGRQVGASFGVALLATVLTNRLSANGTSLNPGADAGAAMHSFHQAFIVACVLTIVGAAAALLVSDKEAAVSMRQQITIEEGEETASAMPVPAGH
ncbi:MAG TPA: MDR family MFS transporter [Dehalococcoidia bacterium]|jgi:EmrB/QacA subfamily drug resistance transporter